MSTSVVAELTAGFEQPFGELGRDALRDGRAVVVSWPSVPVELIRAAGLRPVLARGSETPTPAADAVLEANLFPSRLRQLVEAALTGRLANTAAIVLPRTSDPDYKCFLYLREFVRRGMVAMLPPVLLFDLLHSEGSAVPAYDLARTRELGDRLSAISGQKLAADALRHAIVRSDAARAAARRLDALRRREPRVHGAEALPLLGAFWQMDPERYVALATAAADALATRSPLEGPRVLLAGAPVDSIGLHQVIESHGATVVAELSPYGSACAGEDIGAGLDPIAALADKYRRDSIDARTPVAVLEHWIENSLAGIDVVAVSLPPDDACFGWDYPLLRETLEQKGIAHVVVHADPAEAANAGDHGRVETLVAGARRSKAARYG